MTTMICERCHERLIDYHYGELAFEDAHQAAEHLAECAECALEYCRLSAALAGFRVLREGAPRPEVHRRLRAKVAAAFAPPPSLRLFRLLSVRVPIYQPALLVLLLLFVWTLIRSVALPELRTIVERFDGTRVDLVDVHIL